MSHPVNRNHIDGDSYPFGFAFQNIELQGKSLG